MPYSGGMCFLHHSDHFPLTIPDGARACGHRTGIASAVRHLKAVLSWAPRTRRVIIASGQKLCTGFTLVWVVHRSVSKRKVSNVFSVQFFSS